MTRKAAALRHLKRVDPHFYKATLKYHTSLPLQLTEKKTRPQLFESLVNIVISQQLGVFAARSIFARVKEVCGNRLSPQSILKTRGARLRAAGLSGSKVKTLKTIARAIQNGELDLLVLKKLSEKDASEKLMKIWGLGPWSVEMFLMDALGHGDVFSPGDLGLVRAMEALYTLPRNAPRASLLAIAKKWSPHRTYASLLLWRIRDMKAG
ncbi:MAG: DNA-3-methyladenine glycosylase 2 family protein [bacterium]|nr:DNA-3-methyladenine glycosylase 2 family protein [bacterium]